MSEEMANVALGVHRAKLRIKRSEENVGCAELLLRSDSTTDHVLVAGYLRKYLELAGEISVALHRPSNAEVIGKIMRHLSDLGFFTPGDAIEAGLVKAFTVYLRGGDVDAAE